MQTKRRAARTLAARVVTAAAALLAGGCTSESTRLALETQRRADDVQAAIFERQHDGLKVLLYREARGRLEAAGSPEERDRALSEVFNERDLIEFWAIQNERAAALRMIGVDAKLFANQSIVDLLIKQLEAQFERIEQAAIQEVARHVELPAVGN
jgi:hypothetical protein